MSEPKMTPVELIRLSEETPFFLHIVKEACDQAEKAGLPCDVDAMRGYCPVYVGTP